MNFLDNRTILQNCDAIIESIKNQYHCTYNLEGDFISSFYLDDRSIGKTGDRTSYDPVHYQRNLFINITFNLKTDLLPEDVKDVTAKFIITQPVKSWKDGPYQVITLKPEMVDAYYIWAKYPMIENLLTAYMWKKYTPGDKIIGEPEVRKETITKSSTGKVGSSITFKILRSDLVEHPLNVLRLERFLAKYCPLKVRE